MWCWFPRRLCFDHEVGELSALDQHDPLGDAFHELPPARAGRRGSLRNALSCDAIQAARAALHLAAPDALSGIPRGLDVNDVEARAVHLDDTVECRRRSALSTA
jgi:hypothetical protein